MTQLTAVGLILKTCREIRDGRLPLQILGKQMEELGELATEINIKQGYLKKQPGKDGIIGEVCDVLITTIDQAYVDNSEITEQQLMHVIALKLAKWKGYYDSGFDSKPLL